MRQIKRIIDCFIVICGMIAAALAVFANHADWATLVLLATFEIWINMKFQDLEETLKRKRGTHDN